MKFLIVLATILHIPAFAQTNALPYSMAVESVSCRSGASVNFLETVKVGEIYKSNILPREAKVSGIDLNAGLVFVRLDHPITHETGYGSGRPPCPTGDVIRIEFSVGIRPAN